MNAALRVWIGTAALGLASACAPAAAAPCAGFTDVDTADPITGPFCDGVTWMKNRGITLGCTATEYCPDNAVTRLQMSAFMSRLEKIAGHYVTDATGAYMGKWTELDGRPGVELVVGGRLALIVSILPSGFNLTIPAALFETIDCTGQPYTFPEDKVGFWGRYYARTYSIGGRVHAYFWADLPVRTQAQSRTVRSTGRLDGSGCTTQTSPLLYSLVEFTMPTYELPNFVPPFKLH